VEVWWNGLPLVGEVAQDTLRAGLKGEEVDVNPGLYEGADAVSLAGAGRSDEQDIDAGEGGWCVGHVASSYEV